MARDFGTKPEMLWVETKDLHVNEMYQRSAHTKRGARVIETIVHEFHWPLFQPVTITKRAEGGYWLVDGQHRWIAASRLKIQKVPATLVDLKGDITQAQAFVDINTARVAMTPLSIFHARLIAGDEEACKLAVCCKKAGVEIPRTPKMRGIIKPNETMSVKFMTDAMNKFGTDALVWALKILRAAYPDESGVLSGVFIRVMAFFYDHYQDHRILEKELIYMMMDHDFHEFWRKAAREAQHVSGPVLPIHVARQIAKAYNKAVPENKRLPLPPPPAAPVRRYSKVNETKLRA